MVSSLKTINVPSLIQGISQQSEQSRGQASAKSQRNCINDILLGSRARSGTDLLKYHEGVSGEWDNCFLHEINRSKEEDYILVLRDGSLKVFNLVDGTECTVTGTLPAYFSNTGLASESYEAVTIEDTTIIANKEKTILMSSSKSAVRTNYGIAHFKSSGYSTRYKLTIAVDGVAYSVTYKTPDNSNSANADYIATNKLAEEFRDTIVTTLIPALNAAGKTGFTVSLRGSSIRIFGGTHDFTLSTEDGLGGVQFIAFVDRVKKFSDLPVSSWDGYEVAVGSSNDTSAFDYYLKYSGEEQDGKWQEVVAPDTPDSLLDTTMPHLLVNTGLNTFEVKVGVWGKRIAGDGIDTSLDPEVVGKTLEDLQFIDGRLALICEGYYTLSRSRNAYSFFPDTAQTTLDTDPISFSIANGKITLVRKGVVIGKNLQLWANEIQLTLSSGQDIISQDTVENVPTTNYEYDGRVAPTPVGMGSLVFGTSKGRWNKLIQVFYRGEAPSGEIEINGHCPRLLRGNLRDLQIGSTSGIIAALTDESLNSLYLYQWYNNGDERIQSAWNILDFPLADEVLWAGVSGGQIKILFRWGDSGMSIETLTVEYDDEDPEGIQLRSDHTLIETDFPDRGAGSTKTIELPYSVPEELRDRVKVYHRIDDAIKGEQRGLLVDVEWLTDTSFEFETEIEDLRFCVGANIYSERVLSRIYVVGQDGTVLVDRINIGQMLVSHTQSTEYRVEVRPYKDTPKITSFTARSTGTQAPLNSVTPVEKSGTISVEVGYASDEAEIALVNDSIYPSSWESLQYRYKMTMRAGR